MKTTPFHSSARDAAAERHREQLALDAAASAALDRRILIEFQRNVVKMSHSSITTKEWHALDENEQIDWLHTAPTSVSDRLMLALAEETARKRSR
ncbi:MAG TPA: hypothetical protein VGG74_24600 [Kofleriaceae bacterium]|jgi:hypothetical protein